MFRHGQSQGFNGERAKTIRFREAAGKHTVSTHVQDDTLVMAEDNTNPIEGYYTDYGSHEVAVETYDCTHDRYSEYKIWYPADLADTDAVYPVVVFANGTGITYDTDSNYIKVFEHLASWGFISIGNNDEESWRGDSTCNALDFLIALNEDESSVFYGKVDVENVGISGHSQGGVAVFNAAAQYDGIGTIQSVFAASATSLELSADLEWSYDPAAVNVPCFLVAGTGSVDSGIITPLDSLIENYDSLDKAVMGRRVDFNQEIV